MTLTALLSRSGTILSHTAGTTLDTYGEALQGTTSTAVSCEIQQERREEPGEAGEFSVTEWVGFFPIGTTLDTGDQVVCSSAGGTFEVVGEPWNADSGSSAVHHVEATLKRTAGAA
jgi:hypothetical protein